MSERRCRASSARSGALSRSGWPATAETSRNRGSDTHQSARPLRPWVCQEMEALNLGTGHGDAVQRCPPPLRTTQSAGLIPALCERHDDTSSADRYWLTVLTEPGQGRSDTPRTHADGQATHHARCGAPCLADLTTPLPCPAAALEANDLGDCGYPFPRCPDRGRRPSRAGTLAAVHQSRQVRTTQPISSVRTGSESGRPALSPRPRSPSVAQCDTRSTAVVLATVR